MADKFYAKGPGNNGYIKNLEVLSFCGWDNKSAAFQMQLYKTEAGKYYIYGSGFGGIKGASVVIAEVTDPEHPRFVNRMFACDPDEYPTTTISKVQVAEDKLICAMTAGSGPDALVDQGDGKPVKSQTGHLHLLSERRSRKSEIPGLLGLRSSKLPRCSSFPCITEVLTAIFPAKQNALKE